MKALLVAGAACALAIALSGCAAMSPFAVDTKAAPEAQVVQAQAKADVDKAFAARLPYCEISGSFSGGANVGAGIAGAGTGAGLNTTASFKCEAKPWDAVAPVAAKP